MKRKISMLVAVASLAFTATSASAGTFFSNLSGLSSPESTLTFSEVSLPHLTLVTNQYPGVTFGNAVYNDVSNVLPPIYLSNYAVGSGVGQFPDLSFTFDKSLTDVAFELVTNPGNTTINLFLAGALVDSGTVASGVQPGSYYGYTGGLFDRVQIIAPVNNALLFDNLQFNAAAPVAPVDPGAVPEPATWGLMLLGFGMIGASMRRGRREPGLRLA